MGTIIEMKEKLQEVYAQHAIIFDKGIQFILATLTFYEINGNLGFMKAAASPAVTLALAVICTFLPPIFIVFGATALILLHLYGVSLGALIVAALIFAVMYIFFFRLTPKMTMVVILMPLAFVFKVPLVVPMAYALLSTPVAITAIACGTVTYYMLEYFKVAASGLTGGEAPGLMEQLSTCTRQIFQNKEMWISVIASMIAFLVVYTLRKLSVNHAWTIAIIVGAVVYLAVGAAGDVVMGVKASYGAMVFGDIIAVIVGLVLEVLFFAVDYTRCENLQYEDDEYYYYVKAVPKLNVAKPEKQVKHISERKESEVMDAEAVREKRRRQPYSAQEGARHTDRRYNGDASRSGSHRSAGRLSGSHREGESVDEQLFRRSMQKELR